MSEDPWYKKLVLKQIRPKGEKCKRRINSNKVATFTQTRFENIYSELSSGELKTQFENIKIVLKKERDEET